MRLAHCVLTLLFGVSILGCGKKTAEDDKKDQTNVAKVDPEPQPSPRPKELEIIKVPEPKKDKEATEKKEDKDPKPPVPEPGVRIAFIAPAADHEYWKGMRNGATRAVADLAKAGFKVTLAWDAPKKEYDAKEQADLLDRLAPETRGLIFAPFDAAVQAEAVKRIGRKMPVVLVDRALDAETMQQERERILVCFVPDHFSGGKLAAEKLLAALAADGKTEPRIAVLRLDPMAIVAESRVAGFLEGIKEAQKKGTKITLVSTDRYVGFEGREKALDFVTQFGADLDGLFVPAEPVARPVLDALKARNLRKLAVVAADVSDEMLRAVRDGDLRGAVMPNPEWLGYMSVWAVAKHLDGYDVNSAFGQDTFIAEEYIEKGNVDTSGRSLIVVDPESTVVGMPDLKKRKQ